MARRISRARPGLGRLGWIVVAAAGLMSSGCYKATVINDQVPQTDEPAHEEWTDFFIFGLVGTQEFDVRSYCAGPASKVRTGGNAGTWIVSGLTLGIYTPHKVYIYCPAVAQAGGVAP